LTRPHTTCPNRAASPWWAWPWCAVPACAVVRLVQP